MVFTDWRSARVSRRCAMLAAGFAVLGTAALTIAVAVTALGYGYVSEAGAPGAPLRLVYRGGIFALAAALALLAVAVRPLVPAAALALAASAPLTATSGTVSCTRGCPLPPYESPSVADLVHAVASAGALALAAVAMMLIAAAPDAEERLRRISRLGAGLTVPLLAAVGLAMLLVGRGYVSGVLERIALLAALGWLAWAAVVVRLRA
jgi:hypothetical protein